MSTPYLDTPVKFDEAVSPQQQRQQQPSQYDSMTSGEMISSHPAISYPSPLPYQGQDMSYHSPTITEGPRTPYASSYEGGFSEMPPTSGRSSPEAPSIERGNRLLSFQPSACAHAVLDYSMRQTSLSIQAQLHGMFFLAESSRTLTGELASSPAELTCYRRNLFQITGNVTLPRMMQYVIDEQGERLPIVSQELTISATESVEGSPVKIISVPWKTPATGTAPTPEEKVEKEPTSIPLDQSANHDVDAEYSVFPIAWKRLQFRVATANNGRRRELQQHFTIKLSVTATLSNNTKISLCDALSGPIIVRGRSPRNFQQRKDVPLSGSGLSMPLRRGSPGPGGFDWQHPAITSAPLSPYQASLPDLSSSRSSHKRKHDDMPELDTPGYDNGGRNSAPPSERPRKLMRSRGATVSGAAASTYMPTSAVPIGSPHGSPHLSHAMPSSPHMSQPVPTSAFTYGSPLPTPHYYGGFPKGQQAENSELIHEYFPAGVDEWAHSDSVYRPHFTHVQPPVASVGGGPRGYYPEELN